MSKQQEDYLYRKFEEADAENKELRSQLSGLIEKVREHQRVSDQRKWSPRIDRELYQAVEELGGDADGDKESQPDTGGRSAGKDGGATGLDNVVKPSPPTSEDDQEPCTNCDDRKCMDCVCRVVHDECVDDCPFCCETDPRLAREKWDNMLKNPTRVTMEFGSRPPSEPKCETCRGATRILSGGVDVPCPDCSESGGPTGDWTRGYNENAKRCQAELSRLRAETEEWDQVSPELAEVAYGSRDAVWTSRRVLVRKALSVLRAERDYDRENLGNWKSKFDHTWERAELAQAALASLRSKLQRVEQERDSLRADKREWEWALTELQVAQAQLTTARELLAQAREQTMGPRHYPDFLDRIDKALTPTPPYIEKGSE